MLALPLHDFFRLISDLCACSRHAGVVDARILSSDEVVLLTLVHAGTAREPCPEPASPGGALLSLLRVAGWAVRRQLAAELGLRFMSTEDHRERALALWKPGHMPPPGLAGERQASQTLN